MSHSIHKIGRWDLGADIAAKAWDATWSHLVIPKIQVEAQIVSTCCQSTCIPQHTLTLTYLITIPQLTDHPNHSEHDTKNNIEYNDKHILSPITPWFVWTPLVSEIEQENKTADFLWQSTCLECFLAGRAAIHPPTTQQYIEINVASSGHCAIYHFDDYRTPDIMPPKKLTSLPIIQQYLQTKSLQQNAAELLTVQPITTNFTVKSHTKKEMTLGRQVQFDLSPLAQIWDCLTLIQPTVILQHQHSQQQFLFAPKHSRPPDFHQYQLWHDIHFVL